MSTLISLNEQEKKQRAEHIQEPKIPKPVTEDTKLPKFVTESITHCSTIACGNHLQPGTSLSRDEAGHLIRYGTSHTPEHVNLSTIPEHTATQQSDWLSMDNDPIPKIVTAPSITIRASPSLEQSSLIRAGMFEPTEGMMGHISSVTYNWSLQPPITSIEEFEREFIFRFEVGRHTDFIYSGIPQAPSEFYKEENDPEWRKKIDPRLMDISPQWYDEMMDRSSTERTLRQIAIERPRITSGSLISPRSCIVGQAWGGNNDYVDTCHTCKKDSWEIPGYAERNDSVKFVETVNHFVEHFHNVHKSHVPDYRAVMK